MTDAPTGGSSKAPAPGSEAPGDGKKAVTPGTHFVSEATAWTVPEGGWAGRGFSDVATGRWSTMDLDGDRRPDLVVPADPQASDPTIHGYGRVPFWQVFKGSP